MLDGLHRVSPHDCEEQDPFSMENLDRLFDKYRCSREVVTGNDDKTNESMREGVMFPKELLPDCGTSYAFKISWHLVFNPLRYYMRLDEQKHMAL